MTEHILRVIFLCLIVTEGCTSTTTSLKDGVIWKCNFDNNSFCAFENVGNYKWILASGQTASAYTGPNCDHTSCLGKYAYIEASQVTSESAELKSRAFKHNDGACLTFWYNMYGLGIGSLSVFNAEDTELFKKKGNQGQRWYKAIINIPRKETVGLFGFVEDHIRFVALRGLSYQGDIALDDVYLTEGYCADKPTSSPSFSTKACRQVRCRDSCPTGYKYDTLGCQTCDCKYHTTRGQQVATTLPHCWHVTCQNDCGRGGYERNLKGCPTCICRFPQKTTVPPHLYECNIRCPTGYGFDPWGRCYCRQYQTTQMTVSYTTPVTQWHWQTTTPGHVECGGKISRDFGTIQSPQYPNYYQNRLDCVWYIDLTNVLVTTKTVYITFKDFQLEESTNCSYDRLIVGKYSLCNSWQLFTNWTYAYKTRENVLKIQFQTDNSVGSKGFDLKFKLGTQSHHSAICPIIRCPDECERGQEYDITGFNGCTTCKCVNKLTTPQPWLTTPHNPCYKTFNPWSTTWEPWTTTRSPWRTTRHPWRTTRDPWRTTRDPWRTTHNPWRTTQDPWRTTRDPWRTTRDPWNTTRDPWRTTRYPWRTTRDPWKTTRYPWRTTRDPWRTTPDPLRTTQNQWRTTRYPWRTTRDPWRTTREPWRTTRDPWRTTRDPWRTTQDPWRTTLDPWRTTRDPWRTTRHPWRTTRDPWRTTRDSWRTTRDPWRTTRDPWRTTRDPWRTTRDIWRTTRDPWRTTRDPWRTTRDPWRTTRDPWRTTRDPWRTTRDPWRTTRDPWRTTRDPWRTTRNPWITTQDPCFTTHHHWRVTTDTWRTTMSSVGRRSILLQLIHEFVQSASNLEYEVKNLKTKAEAIASKVAANNILKT